MKQGVQKFLQDFGQAVVDHDLEQAATYLAKWHSDAYKCQFMKELKRREVESEDDQGLTVPDSVSIQKSSETLQELRAEGVPLPREVTPSNFQAWCCVNLQTEADEQTILRFWVAVVREDENYRLGYVRKDSVRNKN